MKSSATTARATPALKSTSARSASPKSLSQKSASSAAPKPSLRKQGFGKVALPPKPEAPAPAAPSRFSANLVFAGASLCFGLALLIGWRFGPTNGNPASIMLVFGLLATFGGAGTAASELGLKDVFSGEESGDGGGDGGD
jgi:hypothetical protein